MSRGYFLKCNTLKNVWEQYRKYKISKLKSIKRKCIRQIAIFVKSTLEKLDY